MAQSFSQKMQELKRVIRLHANWLVYATLGESALSSPEVTELKKYGKLPMGQPLDLVDKSYLLGKFRALYKRNEYGNVNYEEVPTSLTLSPIEELVVEQARLRAGQHLKGVSQEIADGVYASLSQVLGKAVSEAVVSQTVADETALAIIYRKTAQELASNLASRLQTGQRRNWKIVAETAMHTAKVAGSAQAIVNKVGIYVYSDGPESLVSIVPGQLCCADCTSHYIGPDGQPRVFRLATLMGAGSNADGDVTHTKRNGQHTNWKTTLPPLHVSCGCSLEYVPPGHSWVDGKLSMLDKSLFSAHLAKARSGVSGGISPTVEPKGAPSNQKEGAGVASLPGAAAPGNHAGPGRPSGGLPKPGSGTPGGAGGGPQFVACPFGGGADCLKHGGNGAAMHKPGGAIMKKHQEAMAHGAKPTTPDAIEAQHKQMDATAIAYNGEPHARDVTLNHLSEGDIGSAKNLSSEGLAGQHVSHKVTIVGNGSGVMKPAPAFPEAIYKGHGWADGAANMPKDSGHKSEVGASNLAHSMGLTDHVPPTVARASTGEHGTSTGATSLQQWKDGYLPASFGTEATIATPNATESGSRSKSGSSNAFEALRGAAPDKDKFDTKMSEIAVMDVVMNNNDRHMGNLVVNKDHSDIVAIDHGLSFASGMQGHKNGIHYGMEAAGKPLTVPDHLMTRFKNSSLGSTERAMEGSGLQPWQVQQTFLRQQYVAHLQETHGYVPPEATRYILQGAGKNGMPRPGASFGEPGADGIMDRMENYQKVKDEGQLPDQLFASFAKDYIQKGLAKKDSPEHSDFQKMADAMPLHAPGRAHEEDYHGSEDHQNHWDSVPAYKGVKCESFASRYNKKQPEAPKPLRTAPSIPGIQRQGDQGPLPKRGLPGQSMVGGVMYQDGKRVDVGTVKPAKKAQKSLWLDPSAKFPIDKLDK